MESVSPPQLPVTSGLSHMTCFGEQDVSKGEASRALQNAHVLGLALLLFLEPREHHGNKPERLRGEEMRYPSRAHPKLLTACQQADMILNHTATSSHQQPPANCQQIHERAQISEPAQTRTTTQLTKKITS